MQPCDEYRCCPEEVALQCWLLLYPIDCVFGIEDMLLYIKELYVSGSFLIDSVNDKRANFTAFFYLTEHYALFLQQFF